MPIDRWSNFHGFGTGSRIVMVLEIQDPGQADAAPERHMEVVEAAAGVELWEMYDGWLLRMATGA